VEKWGRVTHKHACPNRTEPWCQTHPEWCQVAYAAAPPPAAAPHKFERGWLFCRLCGLPQERHAQEDSK